MDFAQSDKERLYIKDKTSQLLRRIIIIRWVANIVIGYALFLAVSDYSELPISVILISISYFGSSACLSNYNLHVDVLGFHKRDLDRDVALELEGYELRD